LPLGRHRRVGVAILLDHRETPMPHGLSSLTVPPTAERIPTLLCSAAVGAKSAANDAGKSDKPRPMTIAQNVRML
jgi:hypothetical protein